MRHHKNSNEDNFNDYKEEVVTILKNNGINDIDKKISYPYVIKKTNYNESGIIYCNNKDELIENYAHL